MISVISGLGINVLENLNGLICQYDIFSRVRAVSSFNNFKLFLIQEIANALFFVFSGIVFIQLLLNVLSKLQSNDFLNSSLLLEKLS